MKREIIFRGKQKSNGDWVHGDLSYHRDGRVFIRCWDRLQFNPAYNAYEVNPETVGQFTGLTDKNRKMIFEGDVLACDNVCEDFFTGEENCAQRDIFSVIWHNGEWATYSGVIRLSDGKKKIFGICDDCGLFDELNSGNYVVIGNIHDNPELLENGT